MIIAPGTTSQSIDVQLLDDSGLPVTGLVAATFPAVYWSLAGNTAATQITLADLALITTAYTSGGVKERTGSAGVYRLDIPNAALASGGAVKIYGEASGKRLLCEPIVVADFIASITTIGIGVTTALARLGTWAGTGFNTVLGAFRAIASKAAGITPSDLTDGGLGFANETDSLESLRDRGDAAWTTGSSAGSGARTVTITVNDGAAALEGAKVRLYGGSGTPPGPQTTNSSGQVTVNLDDGTWTVAITRADYSFAGATLVVDGNETATYSMTLVSIPAPSAPDRTVGTGMTLDTLGNPEGAVAVQFQLSHAAGEAGLIWTREIFTLTSDSAGLLQEEFPQGVYYRWRRNVGDVQGAWSPAYSTGNDASFTFPELVGVSNATDG